MKIEDYPTFHVGYLRGLATTSREIESGDQVVLRQCADSIERLSTEDAHTKDVIDAARRASELHGHHREFDICPDCDLHLSLKRYDDAISDSQKS